MCDIRIFGMYEVIAGNSVEIYETKTADPKQVSDGEIGK